MISILSASASTLVTYNQIITIIITQAMTAKWTSSGYNRTAQNVFHWWTSVRGLLSNEDRGLVKCGSLNKLSPEATRLSVWLVGFRVALEKWLKDGWITWWKGRRRRREVRSSDNMIQYPARGKHGSLPPPTQPL